MKGLLLVFIFCFFLQNAWTTNVQRHIDFQLEIDGEYRTPTIDSLSYYNPIRKSFEKLGIVVCDAKGANISAYDYDKLMSADSIFMYINYQDTESNTKLSISIPLSKQNLCQSFLLSTEKSERKGKYYFYLGKRKGLNSWIGIKKRKIRQRFTISINNGYSTYGFVTEFPRKSGLLKVKW